MLSWSILVWAACFPIKVSTKGLSRDGSHRSHGTTTHKRSSQKYHKSEVPLNQTLVAAGAETSKPTSLEQIPSPPSAKDILFYSFFVSMEKSAGYALPFANKVCYMEKYGYRWLLDVVPPNKVPKRPGQSGSLHMAPTWYKPGGILKWLEKVDYLVYLDMDLVVKTPTVDFAARFVGTPLEAPKGGGTVVADLTVTDHNRALNNGAFVLRGSTWGKKFVARWVKISNTKFPFPFTDNGSFIETILSFVPGYAASNHACMKPGIKAPEYLQCAVKYLDAALGKFTGASDRVLVTEDGGVVRFVAPKNGFNSHEWNRLRPAQGWSKEACFQPGWFVLHTKKWTAEVPSGSERCAATSKAQLTTSPGEHLYGDWGSCTLGNGKADKACADRLPKKGKASAAAALSLPSLSSHANKTAALLQKASTAAAAAAKDLDSTFESATAATKVVVRHASGSELAERAFSSSSSSSATAAAAAAAAALTNFSTGKRLEQESKGGVNGSGAQQPSNHTNTHKHRKIGLDKATGKKLHAEFLKKAGGKAGALKSKKNHRALPLPPPSTPPPPLTEDFLATTLEPIGVGINASLVSGKVSAAAAAAAAAASASATFENSTMSSSLSLSSHPSASSHSLSSPHPSSPSSLLPSLLVSLFSLGSGVSHSSHSSPSSPPPGKEGRGGHPTVPFLFPKIRSSSSLEATKGGSPQAPQAPSLPVCTALPPLSRVTPMSARDRFAAVSVPKTATTSLTELLKQAGLEACCGGVLWQTGNPPAACPKQHQTPVKIMPYDWEATERGGRPKKLSHLLHNDYAEAVKAWRALGHSEQAELDAPENAEHAASTTLLPLASSSSAVAAPKKKLGTGVAAVAAAHLRLVVVLRDPTSRLYSAYVHGKHFQMRNQMSPKDSKETRKGESTKQRMDRFRHFYWSYRDYNDTALAATDRAKTFEEFAALPGLPTHNQQTRMLAGVGSRVPVTPAVVTLAKAHLCRVECVGVLEDLDPLVACMRRQLGPRKQRGGGGVGGSKGRGGGGASGGGGSVGGPLQLPKKNVKAGQTDKSGTAGKRGGVRRGGGGLPFLPAPPTAKEGAPPLGGSVTVKAREAVKRNSWADVELHAFARQLVQTRPD